MIKKIKEKISKRKLKNSQTREYYRNLPSSFDEGHITWQAKEYEKPQRGAIWQIVMASLVTSTVVLGYLYNSWTFTLAVLVFTAVYYLIHKEEPQTVNIILSDIGVKVGHRKYPYNKIKAFWVTYEPPFTKTVHIRVLDDMALDIPIQLNEQNPAEVREFLIDKIPEMEGKRESLSDIYIKLFKL